MAKKVGVYVCGGCGIGGCLDPQRLVDLATAVPARMTDRSR